MTSIMYHLCLTMYHLLYHLFGLCRLVRGTYRLLGAIFNRWVELTISLIAIYFQFRFDRAHIVKWVIINAKSGLYFRKIHFILSFWDKLLISRLWLAWSHIVIPLESYVTRLGSYTTNFRFCYVRPSFCFTIVSIVSDYQSLSKT